MQIYLNYFTITITYITLNMLSGKRKISLSNKINLYKTNGNK